MIGPPFIRAAESMSPQSSIDLRKASDRSSSARFDLLAGNTPSAAVWRGRSRRLRRPVLACEPGQRAGLGERGLGLVAGSCCAFAKMKDTECAGRQVHHLPVRQTGRRRPCDVGLRERRRRADHERCALRALAMSVVTSASFTSRRPLKSLTAILPPFARCVATAVRRDATAALHVRRAPVGRRRE